MPEASTTKAHRKELNRERYYWYKEHGICVCCGRTWAEPGQVHCKECETRKRWERSRRDPGGEKHKTHVRQIRLERQAAGLCIDCGEKTEGFSCCPKCLARRRESWRVYKIRKRMQREAEKARKGATK